MLIIKEKKDQSTAENPQNCSWKGENIGDHCTGGRIKAV